jgi:hypothetical protein
MEVHGRYNGLIKGYKAQHESEYLREFPRLQAMRAQRDKLLRYTPSFAKDIVRACLKELAAFEAYMDSLCEVKFEGVAENLVTTAGKNYLLDNGLAGSGYTAAFYLGLISSTSYSTIVAADTMASHSGWLEAGIANNPTYSESARRTAAWSSAASGSKALSAALRFTFTGAGGTVKGCFLTTVATKDGTTGTLYSAGLFSSGDQPVVATNTLDVSYTATLT